MNPSRGGNGLDMHGCPRGVDNTHIWMSYNRRDDSWINTSLSTQKNYGSKHQYCRVCCEVY